VCPGSHTRAHQCAGAPEQVRVKESNSTRGSTFLEIPRNVAIGLGTGITCLNLFHLNPYFLLLGPSLVLAGILARRPERASRTVARTPPFPTWVLLLAWISFLLLLVSVAFLAHSAVGERSPLFFMLAATATTVLALAAKHPQDNLRLAAFLGGAILLSLVLRGSVFFLTPGLVGSDAWGHVELSKALVLGGHVPAVWDSPYYLHYPAYHLTVALGSIVSGLSVKAAVYGVVGIPLACSTLFLCVAARRLGGRFAACLSVLLVLGSSYHLQWGTQIIPTSMGLSLFAFALMLTLDVARRPAATHVALLLVTCTTLVLCHTVSSFILWTALLALLAGSVLRGGLHSDDLSRISTHSIVIPLLYLTVVMFAYWGLSPYTADGDSFLNRILLTLRDSVTRDAAFLDRPAQAPGLLPDQLLAISGFALYYFLAAVGFLSSLRPTNQASALRVFAFATTALTAFVLIFPLFGIRNILPHRWFAFIWVLAAPLAAVGVSYLSSRWRRAATRLVTAAAVLWLFSFLMATAPVSNTDSPLYATRITQRLTFHQSELSAAEWVAHTCSGPFASDLVVAERVMGDYLGLEAVAGDLARASAPVSQFYLWRATTLTQPVQVAHGSDVVLTPLHAEAVEAAQTAVYSNRCARVCAPVATNEEGVSHHGA
jgi:hypothetical protein